MCIMCVCVCGYAYVVYCLIKGAAESPSSPSAINHTSTTITLQWSGLQTCRLVNGVIVKYRVQYAAQPSGSVQSTDQSVDCRNITEMVLTELTPFTTYSIQVAAINEEGDVGMYSGPISEMTNEYGEPLANGLLYMYSNVIIIILFCSSWYGPKL